MIVHNQPTKLGSRSGLSTKERDDDYRAVLFVDGNWRVIICKDNLQWIIQRAKKAGAERRWNGVSYVTSKASLMTLWSQKTGAGAQSLASIPDSFRGDSV